MREGIEPLDRGVHRELRLEHNTPLQVRGQKAVTRNAELLRHIGMYMRDWIHVLPCPTAMLSMRRVGGIETRARAQMLLGKNTVNGLRILLRR